ncbi:MAG: FHA domain-containing protein [Woeseiaceae bacterium]
MELSAAGLREQPFRTHGQPLIVVPYQAQVAALGFLAEAYAHDHGLGLFQGPPFAGKSTILRQFTGSLHADTAFAIVNGAALETDTLLQDMLAQFGYDFEFNSVNELISMLKVFVLQQAAAAHPPLLIVENTHAMSPGALSTLCDLVTLKVHEKSALRLILASDRSLAAIVKAPAMSCIAERYTGSFELEPMSAAETKNYLYAKMRAGGCAVPATVIPEDICLELHAASSGWPGIVDRLVLLALKKAKKAPITSELIERPSSTDELTELLDNACQWTMPDDAEPPTLFITHEGKTLHELTIDKPRLLIGRSEHNDLQINSRFISRHHALFVRHGHSTFLMDLNSTNGTFVNSHRISNLMLKHDDIVQLGTHRIKFVDPAATERAELDDAAFSETIVMQNLDDIRRLLARENIKPVANPEEEAPAAAGH